MARTVIGVFPDASAAESAWNDLKKEGIEDGEITLLRPMTNAPVTSDVGTIGGGVLTIPGIGPIQAVGENAARLAASGQATMASVLSATLPEEDVIYYGESLKAGRVVMGITCDDTLADPAIEVMRRYGAAGLEERIRYQDGTTTAPNETNPAAVSSHTGEVAEMSTGSMAATVVTDEDSESKNPRGDRK